MGDMGTTSTDTFVTSRQHYVHRRSNLGCSSATPDAIHSSTQFPRIALPFRLYHTITNPFSPSLFPTVEQVSSHVAQLYDWVGSMFRANHDLLLNTGGIYVVFMKSIVFSSRPKL
jgi:hypothetical protein